MLKVIIPSTARRFSGLSPAEMRLLILTKLNLSTREMVHLPGISIDAIRKSRYRLRKKLNLEEESSIEADSTDLKPAVT